MSKKEAIQNALAVTQAHGFKLSDELRKQIEDIENPQYRVAVVGKFDNVAKSGMRS